MKNLDGLEKIDRYLKNADKFQLLIKAKIFIEADTCKEFDCCKKKREWLVDYARIIKKGKK